MGGMDVAQPLNEVLRHPSNARDRLRVSAARQRFNQYEALTRNVFAGCSRIKSRTSPRKFLSPSMPSNPWRPSFQTTKRVDPGMYSQRNTTFDWYCLKLKPPGSLVTNASLNAA